jgi:hypothetical protein
MIESIKAEFTRGKISADICAENWACKTIYLIKKIILKTLMQAQFLAEMSGLILPRLNLA